MSAEADRGPCDRFYLLRDDRKLSLLLWNNDEPTEQVAKKYCSISRRKIPTEQFAGGNFNPEKWEKRGLKRSQWPDKTLILSPDEIITQFRNKRWGLAVCMVITWGGIWRTPSVFWKPGWASIEEILSACADEIRTSKSIEKAWSMLTGGADEQLGWTDVMASKSLHFLCRSVGFERNPPVPIDGKIIVGRVWKEFRNHAGKESPMPWRQGGYPFDAYKRYMSAVRIWAHQKKWTTTQVDAGRGDDLFQVFKADQLS